jgi:GNAT superfamily N-acetyltransferase
MIDHPKYHALDTALESLGYEKLDQTTVKTIALTDGSFPLHEDVRTDDHFSPDWIDGFIACNRLESKKATVKNILNGIIVEKIVASVILEGKLVGFGFGALEEEHVGFFDIFLHQDYRGLGYGRRIMESILYQAKVRGAQFGYLQVMDNNYPANRLYENLGFKPFYKYWYRRRNLSEGVWGSQSQ